MPVKVSLPATKKVVEQLVFLPIYPSLTQDQLLKAVRNKWSSPRAASFSRVGFLISISLKSQIGELCESTCPLDDVSKGKMTRVKGRAVLIVHDVARLCN